MTTTTTATDGLLDTLTELLIGMDTPHEAFVLGDDAGEPLGMAYRALDGHPLDHLPLRDELPKGTIAYGFVTGGSAAQLDEITGEPTGEAGRVRVAFGITTDGSNATRLVHDGQDPILLGESDGIIVDTIRERWGW